MKKLIRFLIFLIILIIVYFVFLNKTESYEVSYEFNGFEVVEKYDKDSSIYYFNISKDSITYDFSLINKYSSSRKIVRSIYEINENGYSCVSLDVFDTNMPYVCYKDGYYYDSFYANITEENSNDLISVNNNISIYNNDLKYYIWNGYGVTDVINNKEYNFLSNESYDNSLSYQYDKYLIVADYDSSRTFNKFYIFDTSNNKVDTFDLGFDIDFDSYFLGSVDGDVYLFDRKETVEYKINVDKKKIEVVSDSEGARVFINGWVDVGLNKLVYNDYSFVNVDEIYYNIIDAKLYYYYNGSDKNILVADESIDIVYVKSNDIYYLKDDNLYHYNNVVGEELLLSYFEWNFSFNNKIFVF